MSDRFDILGDESRQLLKKQNHPGWCGPMLATLTEDYFSNDDWIFERKLDGERVLVFREGNEVRLMTRNRKQINNTYPELVDALLAQACGDFVADGEVVAFDGKVTSFSRLQGRMQVRDPDTARRSGIAVTYYLFDLMHLDGHDTTALPLRERKRLLKRAIDFKAPLRFSAHRNADGESYHKEACERAWEGLIAKDANAPYVHSRSEKWLKFKCVREQEFVIGGFTDPKGSRAGFGALMLGYHEQGKLRYAGLVGTGYNNELLEDLGGRLKKLEQDEPPFSDPDLPGTGVHWVRPELVGQVGFTEWTGSGKLRHPRFLGLRRDKNPKDVVREST
ncbi:non-homologous end-joining DNA ligase [Haloferula sargassicola]|uniref:DNA ligase (ATP) n=1 Tax=Haloferula sargassicola TaxID=490096 RepID=A0ABP9UJJ4_9BACT